MRSAELIGLIVLLVLLAAIVAVVVRRWSMTRSGGVDLVWRPSGQTGSSGWTFGQGRFSERGLILFRSFSPLPIPSRILQRDDLDIGRRRSAVGAERDLLPMGSVIVSCSDAGRSLELAVSEEALTGLRAWLEGLPPGSLGVGGERGRLGGA